MTTKIVLPSALFSVGLLAAASVTHAAPATESQPCVFEKYAPVSATHYRVDSATDYGSYDDLQGALLYIPAREGLTREWLALSIERGLAQSSASKSTDIACNPPDAAKVQVRVSSAGDGFLVQLLTEDSKSANEILQWASRVVQQQHLAQAPARR